MEELTTIVTLVACLFARWIALSRNLRLRCTGVDGRLLLLPSLSLRYGTLRAIERLSISLFAVPDGDTNSDTGFFFSLNGSLNAFKFRCKRTKHDT